MIRIPFKERTEKTTMFEPNIMSLYINGKWLIETMKWFYYGCVCKDNQFEPFRKVSQEISTLFIKTLTLKFIMNSGSRLKHQGFIQGVKAIGWVPEGLKVC